ncbi:cytochrome oxidase maturation protein, cbb3-type [Hoeflea sp. IMCC20628]|uniref:cbb3-type cytochrome oxidase assembly protein CcoS n=1 Tax=Hoeflea sp. IMCC20628 TaxID=1620421 RepID=UPI00063AC01F|nr:cbb3-type cytochrome oxidase assembly protein CcoS [Hoeflea sp. IMCC20628]AKH98797.1 cytochrome oxidase maturation protein, cbb3-type [Hoeflea sp. IMCC20628]
MNYLFLIPISISLGAIGLGAFLWSLHTNQYEDLEGAAVRVLNPDAPPIPPRKSPNLKNPFGTRSGLSNPTS